MAPRDRSMLVFVSDIHLTDVLNNASIPRVDTFERFWTRIKTARGERPAHLCFVGDLFDIVRSPSWLQSDVRPYDDPSAEVIARVDSIVDAVLVREALFFKAIRDRVTSGELSVHYVLGNHDRLLRFAKKTPPSTSTPARGAAFIRSDTASPADRRFCTTTP